MRLIRIEWVSELGLTSHQHWKVIRRRGPRFKVSSEWLVERGNWTSDPRVSSQVRYPLSHGPAPWFVLIHVVYLYIIIPKNIFCGGILESACRLVGRSFGWLVCQAGGRVVCKILYTQFLLQFQPDSLGTWHKCYSVVVYVQEAIFPHVSLVIAELWPLEFVKNRLGVDFRGLNSMVCLQKYCLLNFSFSFTPIYLIPDINVNQEL